MTRADSAEAPTYRCTCGHIDAVHIADSEDGAARRWCRMTGCVCDNFRYVKAPKADGGAEGAALSESELAYFRAQGGSVLVNEIDRLRARERKLSAQMEKTAKRFDAMKFDEFAAELRVLRMVDELTEQVRRERERGQFDFTRCEGLTKERDDMRAKLAEAEKMVQHKVEELRRESAQFWDERRRAEAAEARVRELEAAGFR